MTHLSLLGLLTIAVVVPDSKQEAGGPVPAEGKVILNGKPLAGATVVFLPLDKTGSPKGPRQANALTDNEGRFKLETFKDRQPARGAYPAKYHVMVSKRVLPPGVKQPPDPKDPNFMRAMQELQKKMIEVVPEEYASYKTTPLLIEIPEKGDRNISIEIKSDRVPLFGIVKLDGKPLPGATIMFIPVVAGNQRGGPRQANALTDRNGSFMLETVNKRGAMPGHYKIMVSKKVLPPGIKPPNPNNMAEVMAATTKMIESLPRIYTDQKLTPLELRIPKEGVMKEVEIALTSKEK